MASAVRHVTRAFALTRSRVIPALRPAVNGKRFLSGRAPLPDPKWKQQTDLDNKIPSDLDQATGLERAEMLYEMEGKSLFEQQPVGPFGTEASPYVVESVQDERIMGCPGNCDSGDSRTSNEIRWFVVAANKPHKCGQCGQVFALKKIKGAEYSF
mmetsp:Transcript_11755/g.32752  ORF Transcript_11755/g.32752 Transcript_11755/m.32752 type:complete len:155 (+) Transcript_11755:42-506(+)